MRVLLVDDEADLASALAERLDMRGIEAEWVTSGREAMARAASKKYDLAVLDVKMPKIGGLALKEELHKIDAQMKFIFLTGYGSEKDFEKISCEAGEACYMIKPVDIQDLVGLMQKLTQSQGETP